MDFGISVTRLISALTAVHLLVHAVAGCCWHHHAPSVAQAEKSVAERGGCTHAHHGHSPSRSKQDRNGCPCDERPGECKHGACAFARGDDGPQVPRPEVVSALLLDWALFDKSICPPSPNGLMRCQASSEHQPPLPIYLWQQVLLI